MWDDREFTYHTWHPGQAGVDNYLGPHDGHQLSTTSIEALTSGRIEPLVENKAIALLRTGAAKSGEEVLEQLIDPANFPAWNRDKLNGKIERRVPWREVPDGSYKSYRLAMVDGVVRAYFPPERTSDGRPAEAPQFEAASHAAVERAIDTETPPVLSAARIVARYYVLLFNLLHAVAIRAKRLRGPIPSALKLAAAMPLALVALPILALLFPRRVGRSMRHMLADTRQAAKALGDVAIAAHNLRHSGAPQLVAILGSAHAVLFLKALMALGLMPACGLRLAKTVPDMRRHLEALAQRGGAERVIVPQTLFARFHLAGLESPLASRLVIV